MKSPEASLRFAHYPYLTTQAATADFPLLIDGRGISVAERTRNFRRDPDYWKFRDFEKLGIGDQCWGGSAWGYRMRGGRLVINLLIRQGRNIYDLNFVGTDPNPEPAIRAIKNWLKVSQPLTR